MPESRAERIAAGTGIAILIVALVVAVFFRPGDPDEGSSVATPFEYDPEVPLGATERSETGPPGYSLTEVSYDGFEETGANAILVVPDAAAPPYQCVIWQSGLGYTLEEFSLLPPLVRSDYAIFSVEPRSSGNSGDDELRAAQKPRSLDRMLRGTVIDLRRGIDWLQATDRCQPEIGYVGGSFGGILGALLAGSDERVTATALIGAGGDWAKLSGGDPQYFLNDADRGVELERAVDVLAPVDPARWVAEISPRPVLMMNGRLDTFITQAAARALRRAANDPKYVVRPVTGHNPFEGPVRDDMYAEVSAFFDRELQP